MSRDPMHYTKALLREKNDLSQSSWATVLRHSTEDFSGVGASKKGLAILFRRIGLAADEQLVATEPHGEWVSYDYQCAEIMSAFAGYCATPQAIDRSQWRSEDQLAHLAQAQQELAQIAKNIRECHDSGASDKIAECLRSHIDPLIKGRLEPYPVSSAYVEKSAENQRKLQQAQREKRASVYNPSKQSSNAVDKFLVDVIKVATMRQAKMVKSGQPEKAALMGELVMQSKLTGADIHAGDDPVERLHELKEELVKMYDSPVAKERASEKQGQKPGGTGTQKFLKATEKKVVRVAKGEAAKQKLSASSSGAGGGMTELASPGALDDDHAQKMSERADRVSRESVAPNKVVPVSKPKGQGL